MRSLGSAGAHAGGRAGGATSATAGARARRARIALLAGPLLAVAGCRGGDDGPAADDGGPTASSGRGGGDHAAAERLIAVEPRVVRWYAWRPTPDAPPRPVALVSRATPTGAALTTLGLGARPRDELRLERDRFAIWIDPGAAAPGAPAYCAWLPAPSWSEPLPGGRRGIEPVSAPAGRVLAARTEVVAREVRATLAHWFAPDLGLVRLERREGERVVATLELVDSGPRAAPGGDARQPTGAAEPEALWTRLEAALRRLDAGGVAACLGEPLRQEVGGFGWSDVTDLVERPGAVGRVAAPDAQDADRGLLRLIALDVRRTGPFAPAFAEANGEAGDGTGEVAPVVAAEASACADPATNARRPVRVVVRRVDGAWRWTDLEDPGPARPGR